MGNDRSGRSMLLNRRNSLKFKGNTVKDKCRPVNTVANSCDNSFEEEPLIKIFTSSVSLRARTQRSHPGTFWISSMNKYAFPSGYTVFRYRS